jgi:hypothetical protein
MLKTDLASSQVGSQHTVAATSVAAIGATGVAVIFIAIVAFFARAALPVTTTGGDAGAQTIIIFVEVTVVALFETRLGALQIVSQQTITAARLAAIVATGIGFYAVSVVTSLTEMHRTIAAALKLAAFIAAITFVDITIVALLIVVNNTVAAEGFRGATAASFSITNIAIELDTNQAGLAIGAAAARRRSRNKVSRASGKNSDQRNKKSEFTQFAPNAPISALKVVCHPAP